MGRLLKEMLVLGSAGLAILYLLNPTLGFFEFVPDNLPIVGNLDEFAATALLLNALRYYKIDITKLFVRDQPETITAESQKQLTP
ncbi:MAG: DUF1232 domain-containing protein [Chloroflexota bacterium]|nr:DUF1232 domain-containing protein [Chloroflexota bacterium]